MIVKRINIDSLPQRKFNFAVGVPQIPKDEYSLAFVLAGLVRQLLGNRTRQGTIMVSSEGMKEIAEQGAYLEIAEDGEDMVLRVTLK